MDQILDTTPEPVAQPERKPYDTPTLTDFGSLAEITHGAINTGADAGIYS